jgi:putative ABC transport system permease protein
VFTAFGVFWGMFMLVVLVGAGTALERGISSQIESFSTNSCFMWSQRTSLPYKGFRKGRNWDMKNEDIQLIQSTVPELQYIAPMIFSGSNTNNVTRNDKSGAYQIKGMTTDYALIDRPRQVLGRFINQVDVAEKRKVCVIGERVYEVLFPHGEDPIGKDIQVNGIYFQVVGVSGSYGNINVGGSAEESVVLPFSTMQQVFNMGNSIHIMALTAQPGVKVTVLEDKVKAVLKAANNIAPEDESAIGGMNIEEMFTMFLYLGIGIVSLMWVVGLGTLFAGAVGVSNIMLVTVRERTKEIGIRRAIGATPTAIVGQILIESIVLTLIAGVAGLMSGVGVLSLAGKLLEGREELIQNPQIDFGIAVGALVVLMIIGALAGLIPANRAVRIKAIEAIREE